MNEGRAIKAPEPLQNRNIDAICNNLKDAIETTKKLTKEITLALEVRHDQADKKDSLKEQRPLTVIDVLAEFVGQIIQNNYELEDLLRRIESTVGEVKILD